MDFQAPADLAANAATVLLVACVTGFFRHSQALAKQVACAEEMRQKQQAQHDSEWQEQQKRDQQVLEMLEAAKEKAAEREEKHQAALAEQQQTHSSEIATLHSDFTTELEKVEGERQKKAKQFQDAIATGAYEEQRREEIEELRRYEESLEERKTKYEEAVAARTATLQAVEDQSIDGFAARLAEATPRCVSTATPRLSSAPLDPELLRHNVLGPLDALVTSQQEKQASPLVLAIAPQLAAAHAAGQVGDAAFEDALAFMHGNHDEWPVRSLAELLPLFLEHSPPALEECVLRLDRQTQKPADLPEALALDLLVPAFALRTCSSSAATAFLGKLFAAARVATFEELSGSFAKKASFELLLEVLGEQPDLHQKVELQFLLAWRQHHPAAKCDLRRFLYVPGLTTEVHPVLKELLGIEAFSEILEEILQSKERQQQHRTARLPVPSPLKRHSIV